MYKEQQWQNLNHSQQNSPLRITHQDQYTPRKVNFPAVLGPTLAATPLGHPASHLIHRQSIDQLQRVRGNAYAAQYVYRLQRNRTECEEEERAEAKQREKEEIVQTKPALQRSLDGIQNIDASNVGVETGTHTLMCQNVGTPSGPDPCFDLLQAIIELLNEVAKRFNDALNDPHELFKYHRKVQDAHHEHGSWDGHRDRYNYDRGRLRQKLAEWESNDRCRGYRLTREQQSELTEAEEFKEKEFPAKPAPTMKEVDEDPSFREKIADALNKAGVPAWAVAGLVVLVVAALADPEPFSKVALIIGATAAVAFFVLIGRESAVPPSAASTASMSNDETATDEEEQFA